MSYIHQTQSIEGNAMQATITFTYVHNVSHLIQLKITINKNGEIQRCYYLK